MPEDNNPILLTCPTCNAPLNFDGVHNVVRCKFCGNPSVIPVSVTADTKAPISDWDEISRLALSGKLDEAAERFGIAFNSDTDISRIAVEAIANGRLVTSTGTSRLDPQQLSDGMEEIQRLASKGEMIDAIRRYRELFDVDLKSAKETVELIANWNRSNLIETSNDVPTVPFSRKNNRSGTIITVAVLLLLLGGLMALILGGAFTPHYLTTQEDVLIPASGETGQRVVSAFYDPMRDKRFIGLIDMDSGKLRWKSDPENDITSFLAADQDVVFSVIGSRLTAYSLGDGLPKWQTEMSDTLAYGEKPLVVVTGRVLVLTSDQKITAYDAASGKQSWSRQLNAYEKELRLFGNELVLSDYLPDTYDLALYFLNPLTGEEQARLFPLCAAHNSTYTIDSDTLIAYDAPEDSLYLVFSEGCIQRVDLAEKTMTWSVSRKDTFDRLYSGYTYLLTGDSLFFGNAGELVQVRKIDGEIRSVLGEADYSVYPLAQNGDTLLVRAKRTRGTTRFELWGINIDSGTLAWQRSLQNCEPLEPPDEMAGLVDDSGWGWTWHLNDAGLVTLTFAGEPNQVTIETLDPANGTVRTKQVVALKKVTGDFYTIPLVVAWQENTVILDIDNSLFSLDTLTGKLNVIY